MNLEDIITRKEFEKYMLDNNIVIINTHKNNANHFICKLLNYFYPNASLCWSVSYYYIRLTKYNIPTLSCSNRFCQILISASKKEITDDELWEQLVQNKHRKEPILKLYL